MLGDTIKAQERSLAEVLDEAESHPRRGDERPREERPMSGVNNAAIGERIWSDS
jgi:hypothetical protein